MDQFTVNITGLDELEEAFTKGSDRAIRRFIAGAERKAAKVLKDTASANAPYAEGTLSEHIRLQTVKTEESIKVRVGPDREAFYGAFQELGAPEAGVPAQHWWKSPRRNAKTKCSQR